MEKTNVNEVFLVILLSCDQRLLKYIWQRKVE